MHPKKPLPFTIHFDKRKHFPTFSVRQIPTNIAALHIPISKQNLRRALMKVDAYIAAVKEGEKAKKPYDKTHFSYNSETDTYTCPAGEILKVIKTENANNPDKPTKWKYECSACLECPFQSDCVKAKSGKRTVHRTDEDPIREEMRTKVQGPEGSSTYRKRKSIVEPVWGEIKEIQGFRQFHLRTENKVAGEFLLLAVSFNIKKLHSVKFPKKDTVYKREKSAQKRLKAA